MTPPRRVPAPRLPRLTPWLVLACSVLLPLRTLRAEVVPPPLAPASRSPLALTPLPLTGVAGQTLLMQSRQRADYGPLMQEFLTQASLSFCGVASAVMVLNSLQVPAPPASGYGPYHFWTQDNLFQVGEGGPDAGSVLRRGMTLEQLGDLLAGRGLAATVIHADGLELEDLRRLVRRSLADPEDRLLVNYDRREVGQTGGGHISPLAAYDDTGDRVLILDVARYRYPAAWVPLRQLWLAMRSRDPASGRSRGLVMVQPLSREATPPRRPAAATPPPENGQPRAPS